MAITPVRKLMLVLLALCSTKQHVHGSHGRELRFLSLINPTSVPVADDSASAAINIPAPGFSFGTMDHHIVYVGTNGYFSFDRRVTSTRPSFAVTSSSYNYIVAPFGANINIRTAGQILYQTATPSRNSALLSQVNSYIRGQGDVSFSGRWMLVALWDSVAQFGGSPTETNTFQGVLITNNTVSYTVFTYKCDQLEWSRSATIGFQEMGYFETHPFSGSSSDSAIGCVNTPHSLWNSVLYQLSYEALITVDYTPPPGFTPGPNEYRAASGPVTVTCIATGLGIGTLSYQWSSTCRDCPFQFSTLNVITLAAVHSGDNGTHTCAVTRAKQSHFASIEITVVGAGIHIFNGDAIGSLRVPGSLPNNSLAIFLDAHRGIRLNFFCRSDSITTNVGQFIGPDGNVISSINHFFDIDHTLPGEFSVQNTVGLQTLLPPSAQGMYACRIPLQSGEIREINIGIYPSGFSNSPRIASLDYNKIANKFTCISTGSPATTVTWMRDRQLLSIGSTYQLTQTVTNRRESTYKNVLTIKNQRINYILGHIYSCTVRNALGTDREEIYVLSLTITVDYTPPPGFTPGPNEYRAASGPVTVTCTATPGSPDAVSYQWSSTCRSCPFQSATSQSVIRPATHSGDTGTHTCTATRGSYTGSTSIQFHVVGAGIHVFRGDAVGSLQVPGSLPSSGNSLAVFDDPGHSTNSFLLFCRSDSMVESVGELIGLDGKAIDTTHSSFSISTPQPGELRVESSLTSQYHLPSGKQGVYTCRMPLQSGEMREINVGIYSQGFNTPPTILDLRFTFGSSSSTLTCTSTGSPATNVTWTRDERPLTIDGSTYQMTQTLISRVSSAYENVLTMNNKLTEFFSHNYTCTVTNALGSGSSVLQVIDQKFFQLQIGPVEHCITWKHEIARNIEESVQKAIAKAVSRQCKCLFLPEHIETGKFSCQNITTEATYRSVIHGTVSQNASQVLDLVQNWVNSRPEIEVDWWVFDVYADCPIHISSFDDPECQLSTPLSTDRSLITSDPQVIHCADTCLRKQQGGAAGTCRVV